VRGAPTTYGNDAVPLDGWRDLACARLRAASASPSAARVRRRGPLPRTPEPAIGEKVRDFGERLCLAELERRARNEVRLRAVRRELLAKEPILRDSPAWYEWWKRFGARSEREIARKLVRELADLEQEAMPEYLLYYDPWPDHFAHFKGPFSDEILSPSGELNRLDYWLGRIRDAYAAAGVLPQTLFVMAGDHGLTPVFHLLNPEVEIFERLRDEGVDFRVVKISSDEGEGPKLTHRLHPPSMKGVDVVVASTAGGNYMLDLFVDQGAGFVRQPVYSELRAVRPLARANRSRAVDLVHEIASRLGETLDYLAVREDECRPDRASLRLVALRDGKRVDARIQRVAGRIHYEPGSVDLLETDRLTAYEILGAEERGEHASLRQRCVEAARPGDPATWCDESEWRRLTSATPRPDSVVQLAHLYDIDRAGTVNLFPRAGIGHNLEGPGPPRRRAPREGRVRGSLGRAPRGHPRAPAATQRREWLPRAARLRAPRELAHRARCRRLRVPVARRRAAGAIGSMTGAAFTASAVFHPPTSDSFVGARRGAEPANRGHDVLRGGAGPEGGRHALLAHVGRIAGRHHRAAEHHWNRESARTHPRHQVIEVVEVLPGVAAQSDHVDALLDRGLDDVGGQVEAPDVHDLHAGVAQRARDEDGADLVLVHAQEPEQDLDGPRGRTAQIGASSMPSGSYGCP
jgi:hypothetical protein